MNQVKLVDLDRYLAQSAMLSKSHNGSVCDGYLILLGASESDTTLKAHAISDGSIIDYLMPGKFSTDIESRRLAKQFCENLDDEGQELVIEFYLQVFRDLRDYYTNSDMLCLCCFEMYFLSLLKQRIDSASRRFFNSVGIEI